MWISVDETLPEQDTRVLVVDTVGRICIARLSTYFGKTSLKSFYESPAPNASGWSARNSRVDEVVFWMPLPTLSVEVTETLNTIHRQRDEANAEAARQSAIKLNERQTKFAKSLGYASLSDLFAGTVYQILSGPHENKFVVWRGCSDTYTSEHSNLFNSRELAEMALAQFCKICNRTFGTPEGAISHMLNHSETIAV
jgi:Protein of unknown function (DUF551)